MQNFKVINMEVCIPFYLDVDSLRACLDAVKRFINPEHVLVNNASPEIDVAKICEESDLPYTLTELTGTDHCEVLDYLFSKTTLDTVLFLDQDCLLVRSIFPLLEQLAKGTVLLGPLDLFFVTGDHVKGQKIHNFIARLDPIPGYIHTAFMLLNAKVIKQKFGDKPIRTPAKVKLFGYGILGAEPYYGITYHCRKAKLPIEFMFMLPGCYGICAELAYENNVYAVHLWYSSRIIGMRDVKDGKVDYAWEDGVNENGSGRWVEGNVEIGWLQNERERFLKDYWNNKLKIKWGLPNVLQS